MNRIGFTLAALLLFGTTALIAHAQVTAAPTLVNFQGRLATPAGNPVPNGTYSIRFSLWDVASGGTAATNEKWNQTIATVQVKNGTFAVLLNTNTANLFNGNLYLEIKVGVDAALTPRQQIVSVPYAMKANSVADGSIKGASIATGTITADKFAANIFNPLAWLLGGNSATNPATQFLGTTDNQPLNIRVNNRRALRISYVENIPAAFRTFNMLGGADANSIGAGVYGATIAGGGNAGNTDLPNIVNSDYGFLGGGYYNLIDTNAVNSVIGGGFQNNINTGAANSVIVGGEGNSVNAAYAFIGGGQSNSAGGANAFVGGGVLSGAGGANSVVGGGNSNLALAQYAAVLGGNSNIASGMSAFVGGGSNNQATRPESTVSGGKLNKATGDQTTVGGGENNAASAAYATVGGGQTNTASGYSATVGGGANNTAAGDYSFAGGRQAKANHSGSFVWADDTVADFASTAANQFCIRASGGVMLETGQNVWMYTSSTVGEKNRYMLFLNSPQTVSASGVKAGGILCADDFGYSNPGKNDMTVKGKAAIGFDVNTTGGYKFSVNGTTFSFSGYFGSDARYKKNIAPLNNALESILNLRGVSYDWDKAKFPQQNFGQDNQMGFIAQEIEQIFPQLVMTAPDGYKAVNYTGVIPVLVEAVKTLNARTVIQQKRYESEVSRLSNENIQLKARLDAIEAALKANK